MKRGRIRERIAWMNRWAEHHRKRTFALTTGMLSALFLLCLVFSLGGNKELGDDSLMSGIADVKPMFDGIEQIQHVKSYHISQEQLLIQQGQAIRRELDSLVHLPRRTHEDSVRIIVRYRQLEMIVKNLKQSAS